MAKFEEAAPEDLAGEWSLLARASVRHVGGLRVSQILRAIESPFTTAEVKLMARSLVELRAEIIRLNKVVDLAWMQRRLHRQHTTMGLLDALSELDPVRASRPDENEP